MHRFYFSRLGLCAPETDSASTHGTGGDEAEYAGGDIATDLYGPSGEGEEPKNELDDLVEANLKAAADKAAEPEKTPEEIAAEEAEAAEAAKALEDKALEEDEPTEPPDRISLKALSPEDRELVATAKSLARKHGISFTNAMKYANGETTLAEAKAGAEAKKVEDEPSAPVIPPDLKALQDKLADVKARLKVKAEKEDYNDLESYELQDEKDAILLDIAEAKAFARLQAQRQIENAEEQASNAADALLAPELAKYPDANKEGTALFDACQAIMTLIAMGAPKYKHLKGKPEAAREALLIAVKIAGAKPTEAKPESTTTPAGAKPPKVSPVPGDVKSRRPADALNEEQREAALNDRMAKTDDPEEFHRLLRKGLGYKDNETSGLVVNGNRSLFAQ